MAMRMPFNFSTSVVSLEKVRSVEMDLRSLKAMTGLGSMPWALRQMAVPFWPRTCSISSMGISWTVWMRLTPRLRSVW